MKNKFQTLQKKQKGQQKMREWFIEGSWVNVSPGKNGEEMGLRKKSHPRDDLGMFIK